MSKKMLINASHPEENRVAIVVDGILSELDIEIEGQEQTKGNIYKAVVVRVETGLQAAFVDYGAEKLGFLQVGEIHPNLYPQKDDTKGRSRINDLLHRGQEILVQIVKEERGNKGAALTTFLSIPGRYMVLMPDSSTKGVSRKILDETERKKLKKTMAELNLPERMGYIVRTAGIGKEKDELKRDFDYLVRLFEGIVARKDQIKAPAQLYRESNLVIRSIRDYFSAEMDEVVIDDSKVYQEAKDFFSLVMPELSHLVKQHREKRPIFSRFQIEEQIETLSKNQVPLPSGGSIVIDPTEALVAIDVNSGKMASESGIEATAAKTNLEAAAEVGRQLRLRDLGGLIVIDFIDMRDRKHIKDVEQELRKSLKDDKAKVTVGRISQFGLLEMSRQRLKPTLSVGSYRECPHCHGKGRIKSSEAQAVALLRQAHSAASKGHIGHIEASVPLDVANYLLNQKRATLTELEQRLNLRITVNGRINFIPGQLEIELHKREKVDDGLREIAPVTHANQIEIALAAQQEESEADLEIDEGVEAELDQPVEEETPEKKGRKRRRKRRKRSDRRDSDDSDSELLQPGPGEETPQETTLEEIPPLEDGLPPASEPETAKPATETKRRRSRRGGAKRKPTTTAPGDPVEEPQLPVADSVATEEQQHEEKPAAVEKTDPKPKRRARRSGKKVGSSSSPEVPAAPTVPKPEGAETAQASAQPAANVPKSDPRGEAADKEIPGRAKTATASRQTRTKTALKPDPAESPAQPPRRRTRSAAKKVEEQPQDTEAEKETAAEENTADKPKRPRRAPRKKPVAEAVSIVEQSE